MKTVLLERRLPPGLTAGASPAPDGAVCCSPALLTWQAGYVTADRSRAFLLAQAPDLESVRMVIRHCGADVRWQYEAEDHLLDASTTPNMAFELLTTEKLDIAGIAAMVRRSAAGSTPIRILADVGGRAALLLARTPHPALKPAAAVVVKSYQWLASDLGGAA